MLKSLKSLQYYETKSLILTTIQLLLISLLTTTPLRSFISSMMIVYISFVTRKCDIRYRVLFLFYFVVVVIFFCDIKNVSFKTFNRVIKFKSFYNVNDRTNGNVDGTFNNVDRTNDVNDRTFNRTNVNVNKTDVNRIKDTTTNKILNDTTTNKILNDTTTNKTIKDNNTNKNKTIKDNNTNKNKIIKDTTTNKTIKDKNNPIKDTPFNINYLLFITLYLCFKNKTSPQSLFTKTKGLFNYFMTSDLISKMGYTLIINVSTVYLFNLSYKTKVVVDLMVFYFLYTVSEMLLIYNLSYFVRSCGKESFIEGDVGGEKNFYDEGKNNGIEMFSEGKNNDERKNYCKEKNNGKRKNNGIEIFGEGKNNGKEMFSEGKNNEKNLYDENNLYYDEKNLYNKNLLYNDIENLNNIHYTKSTLYKLRTNFFLIQSSPPNKSHDTFIKTYINIETTILKSILNKIKQEHLNLINKLYITVPQVNNTIRKYENYNIIDDIIYKSIYKYKIIKLKRQFYTNLKFIEDINKYLNERKKVNCFYIINEVIEIIREIEKCCGINFKIKAF